MVASWRGELIKVVKMVIFGGSQWDSVSIESMNIHQHFLIKRVDYMAESRTLSYLNVLNEEMLPFWGEA